MIVEIRGANTRNKGAELMLRAIAAELQDKHSAVVEPKTGSYEERARMGLLQKVSNRMPERDLAAISRFLPAKVHRHLLTQYGIVFGHRIDAILDTSGFAYSDQFDLRRCEVAAVKADRARRAGQPYILLPQAFGPFSSAPLRASFARLVDNSHIVYAREPVSLEHVLASGCRTDHVRLAPDFTCLLAGELPPGYEPPERLAVIVPSEKLLTETSTEVRNAYLPFFAAAIAWLRREGFAVHLMLHERGDVQTIAALQDRLDERAPVIRFPSALHLKGVIGRAHLVVGSRFHALVSALSQGVPALGVGWSHKYEMLFSDYGCVDRVVDPTAGTAGLLEHLAALSEGPERQRLVRQLRASASVEEERARAMWSEVHAVLEADALPGSDQLRSSGAYRRFRRGLTLSRPRR